MPHRPLLILVLCAILLAAVRPCPSYGAETLTDANIALLYEDMGKAAQDYETAQGILEKRLDDNYKEERKVTENLKAHSSINSVHTFDKTDAIGMRLNRFSMLSASDYQQAIQATKYAADKKSVDVIHSSFSKGVATIPTDANGSEGTVQFQDQETCTDTVGVVGDMLKILHGDCTEVLSLYR